MLQVGDELLVLVQVVVVDHLEGHAAATKVFLEHVSCRRILLLLLRYRSMMVKQVTFIR